MPRGSYSYADHSRPRPLHWTAVVSTISLVHICASCLSYKLRACRRSMWHAVIEEGT